MSSAAVMIGTLRVNTAIGLITTGFNQFNRVSMGLNNTGLIKGNPC